MWQPEQKDTSRPVDTCRHVCTQAHLLSYIGACSEIHRDTDTDLQSEPVSKESFAVLQTQIKSTTGLVAARANAIFLSLYNTRNTQVHWYEGTDSLQRIEGLLRCKIVALKHHQLHKCYRRRRPMVSCYNHAEAKKYQILLRYKKTSNHAEAKKIKSCRGLSKVPLLLSLENDAFIVEGMTSIMWGC